MTESFTTQARILAVDDEATNLKLLDRMLRSAGYQYTTMTTEPEETLALSRKQRPDLIILDINMPGLDGFQVMQQLRAASDPLMPPILVLSAQYDRATILRALSEGARDYVSKPFDRDELLMRVRNLIDAHLAQRLLHDRKELLEEMVAERTRKLQHSQLQVVQKLGQAAEYRDEETGNHILRMSHISALLAESCGWSSRDTELMLHASPMHDIGKIGIPDSILLKPGKLDADEWAIMQTHTSIGARLLEGEESELLRLAREIALTHHEQWDGSGYPNGLRGQEIPQSGRIVALADVFDALLSVRPYKRAWPVDEAVRLIQQKRNQHFDPELVDIFHRRLPEILDIRAQFAEPEESEFHASSPAARQ